MITADPYCNLGPASILRADARTLPLADNSVDLITEYETGGRHAGLGLILVGNEGEK